MEQKAVKSKNALNQLGQSAKSIGNAYLNAGKNIANTASKTYDAVDKNIVSKIDPNIKNVVKKGVSLIGSPSNASGYPSCIAKSLEKIGNNSVGQIRATPDGKQYSVALTGPIMTNYEGYQFYSDLRLMYPNGKIGKYTCGGKQDNPIVDGKEVDVSWAITYMKDPPTEYEKREAKSAREFGDRFGKRILEPIHDFYLAHPTITTIGVSIIPMIGPWIAGALVTDQTVDAWKNAKTDEEKGLIALGAVCNLIFGMKLGVNATTSTILKKVENATFKTIADKLTSGKANELTTNQISILQEVGNNKTQITGFIDNINSLKPNYIQRFGKQKYENLLGQFISNKINKDVFIKTLKSAEKSSLKSANFVSQYGIKFSQNELNQIHQYTNFIKRLPKVLTKDVLNSINPTIEVMTIDGPKSIRMKFITSKQAVKMWGEKYKDTFGGALDNEIYFVVDNIKKMSSTDLDQLFYHEFAHIKDPSSVSSKLNQSYNSDNVRYSNEYFSKKYYFHPRELVANTAKILNGLSTNVKNIMKTMGKDRVIQGLDDIINWSKGVKKDFTQDMTKILGYDQKYVREHFDFLQKNPTEYRNLVSKVAQQAEYLKSQVNLAIK